MGLNKHRLFIVVGVTGLLTAVAFGLFVLRSGGDNDVSGLQASARQYIKAGEFASGKIEIDKVLRQQPENGYAHYLKGLALLEDRAPGAISSTDSQGVAGIRALLTATRHNANLVGAHRLLIEYFLGTGDLTEARSHAKELLRKEPGDLPAHYASGAALLRSGEPQQAARHIELLLERENPVRPRSAWLAAQLSELASRHDNLSESTESLLQGYSEKGPWAASADRLALVNLFGWWARRATGGGGSGPPTRCRHRFSGKVAFDGFGERAVAAIAGTDRRAADLARRTARTPGPPRWKSTLRVSPRSSTAFAPKRSHKAVSTRRFTLATPTVYARPIAPARR